mgnify:CR=1 FL=1
MAGTSRILEIEHMKQEIIEFLLEQIEKNTKNLKDDYLYDHDYLIGRINMAEQTISFIKNLEK